MKSRTVRIGAIKIGRNRPLVLIAGPCVIESRRKLLGLAARLAEWAAKERVPLVFKASYDKANRSASTSFRGPGRERGLPMLAEVRARFGLPILTDVHAVHEVDEVAAVADVLQVPAFLCRQTDLVLAVGATGKPVNIKKGQFLAPWDVANIVAKLESTGNRSILLTERGTGFGYNNLVADMRSLPIMRATGYPVVFDATHSIQLPSGRGDRSGGEARWAPVLARAAVAAGCDAVFAEVYLNPKTAPCDRDSALSFARLRALWPVLNRIDQVTQTGE